jgi:hypothetical protein
MAAIAGRLGEFWAEFNVDIDADPNPYVPPTGSVTSFPAAIIPAEGYATGALVDSTMNGNVDELETTVHNTSGASPTHGTARTYIPNFHDETQDVTFRYNEEDRVSMAILLCAMNSWLFNFWYRPDGEAYALATSGANQFRGQAFSTSFSPGSPLDDVGTFDVTLRLSGTLLDTL